MPSYTDTSTPLLAGDRAAPARTAHSATSSTANASSETKTLVTALVLTTVFFVIELVGGYVAHSLAIMSDAAHLLSDLAGLAISLVAVSVSRLPANSTMSFGFARAEVLGAFVSIFFIWALTAVLVAFAAHRLFNPTPVNGPLMLLLGAIGLAVNLALGCVLGHSHSHGHMHSHGHAHDHAHGHAHGHAHAHDMENGTLHHCDDDGEHDDDSTAPLHSSEPPASSASAPFSLGKVLFGTDIRSVNVRAAYIHVLGDALQSVGVILASLLIIYDDRLSFVDPICTLLFAVIVIMTTTHLARETMTVLMEAAPSSLKLDDIHTRLRTLPGVSRVGDLHVWSISPKRPALSVHIYQHPDVPAHTVLKAAQRLLADEFAILHATVQINCETVDCCDDTYLGSQSQRKNCVTYQDQTPAPRPKTPSVTGTDSDEAHHDPSD